MDLQLLRPVGGGVDCRGVAIGVAAVSLYGVYDTSEHLLPRATKPQAA
ncbi:MAG TPA: hypothetical protein VFW71_03195 [Actinomycetota bacterium]|nr:hypothetical protein [Actinomycetota bacterium]